MDYHDIGVTICNTVDKCCPTNLTEEQRTALISAVAVWLDKQQAKGREAGMREASEILRRRVTECDNMIASAPLTPRGANLYEDAARELDAMASAILAAIGEGK